MKILIQKTVLSGGWYQWEQRGHKERMRKGKYGGSTMYSYKKME
jgi:hypothetical protein